MPYPARTPWPGCDGMRVAVSLADVMTTAHINRIATAVPRHDIHASFVRFARTLLGTKREQRLFDRLVDRSGIDHRFAVLAPSDAPEGASVDVAGVYRRGGFPGTAERMRLYERHAPELATEAVRRLELSDHERENVSHVIVTTCTGMYAPGLDFHVVEELGLDPGVERTMVGFMGCYAAINGLKLAHHIVRSTPEAKVLMVNLELCSLHLHDTDELTELLSFLVFGDGCAATLISADPTGFAIEGFEASAIPGTSDLITWNVGDLGFDMVLSGRVPASIADGLSQEAGNILEGRAPETVDLWAVHPGGRSVLDAVERGLALEEEDLSASREVLERYGNMSSATVMFVLASLLRRAQPAERGCAMSFGPGLVAETMQFRAA